MPRLLFETRGQSSTAHFPFANRHLELAAVSDDEARFQLASHNEANVHRAHFIGCCLD
jgi:hypothetical protein